MKRKLTPKLIIAKSIKEKRATPSLKVRNYASKILRSLDEAAQIHTGKKDGVFFEDFIKDF